jgi:hypothetical protein
VNFTGQAGSIGDLGKAKRRTKALEPEGSKIKAENPRLTDNW